MCDPVTIGIATAAIAGLQQVSSYVGQNQMASANRQAANYNYAREREAIGRQDVQLQQENSEAAFDTAITSAGERGKIAVSAAENGLAPSSLVSQLNAGMFGIARQRSAELTNLTNRRVALADSRTDAALRRDSQIASKPKATVASLVIGLGSAAVQGVNAHGTASRAGQ